MTASRRSLWLIEHEILAHITKVAGCDPAAARDRYLSLARSGELVVEGRPDFQRSAWQPIPALDWMECVWYDLPDTLATGFHFSPFVDWYHRRVRRHDVEALWPAPHQQPAADKEVDQKIVAWVEGEFAAGRPVRPDHKDARDRCSAFVNYKVGREKLRAAVRKVKGVGPGRPRKRS